MDNYFKKAGDLETPVQSYFKQAGDLETPGKDYFRPAGDLDSVPSKNGFRMPNENDLESDVLTSKTGFERAGDLEIPVQSYFKQAGDLETPGKDYFRPAGDLDSVPSKNGFRMPNESDLESNVLTSRTGFERAGDLETLTEEAIKDYLITIVSGKKYNYSNQFNNLVSGGRMIVTFDKLKKMVDMGYNIITAQYLNKDMIDIEFEYYKEENMGKGRI